MPRKTNEGIQKEYLILCEGRDAQEFLIAYLDSDAMKTMPRLESDIQVIDYGGISDLTKTIQILMMMSNYSSVKNIVILRDAEDDATAAIQSIQDSLRRNGLPVPKEPNQWVKGKPNIAYSLFPAFDSLTSGALEDLCVSIVAEENWNSMQNSIKEFLQIIKNNYGKKLPREFKNKLHTYFSATDEFVSLKIGEAAKAGAFDWNNVALNAMTKLLSSGFDL